MSRHPLSIAVAALAVLIAPLALSIASAQQKSVNSLGMKLVRLEAGEFTMGVHDKNRLRRHHPHTAYEDAGADDHPALPVRLTRSFEIGATEVTVAQFRRFVEETGYVTDAQQSGRGAYAFRPEAEQEVDRFASSPERTWESPGFEQTDEHPVTCVSWRDAVAFCQWLSKQEKATYRLPTEAEWEYACRAGTDTIYWCGNEPDAVYRHANVADAALHAEHPAVVIRQRVVGLEAGSGDRFVFTAPVASFPANPWGLHDTHGNVWEWCSDKYHDRLYEELIKPAREKGTWSEPAPTVDPQGPDSTPQHQHGDWRSMRGGSWYVSPLGCRSAVRAFAEAGDAFSYTGFRVVREVPASAAESDS